MVSKHRRNCCRSKAPHAAYLDKFDVAPEELNNIELEETNGTTRESTRDEYIRAVTAGCGG